MAKKFSFYIINIKIQNNQTAEERSKRYRDLISNLSSEKKILQIGNKNSAVIMYSSLGNESSPYIYGRIAKGLYLPGNEIDVIKDGAKSKESNDPNSVKLPFVARYIFVPDAHRLCIEKIPNGPLPLEVEKYVKEFLTKKLHKDEKLEVVLEKDEKTISKILGAKAVFEIDYKISYTNEDINSGMEELFDKELKDSNIGLIEVKAKADNDITGLKIHGTPILEGGIKLAGSNGEIKKAVIISHNSKKKETISNETKPKILTFEEGDKIQFSQHWYNVIMNTYRSKNA